MRNYVGVCLPRKLTDIVDEEVKLCGYTSRADFVKQAIRNELRNIKKAKRL